MKMNNQTPIIIKGLTVSKGIVIAKCKRYEHGQKDYQKKFINKSDVQREIKKFDKSVKLTLKEIHGIKNKLKPNLRNNIGIFLDTHIHLIKDKSFLSNIRKNIEEKFYCADWAIDEEFQSIKHSFDEMKDAYIKERIDDIKHVVKLLIKNIKQAHKSSGNILTDIRSMILVTDDLSPADVLIAHQSKCSGLISELGGRSSHSSILSRGLEIPSIVGLKNALGVIKDQDLLVLDGNNGIVIINPDTSCINYYRKIKNEDENRKKLLSIVMEKECITNDKQRVEIMANLELPQEIKIIKGKNFDGIGLFRTEYLYTDRVDIPTEAEQVADYKKIVRNLKGKPVIFRTLDIGSDKEIPENIQTGSIARNPALGLRGIRYSLNNHEVFLNQVKAILRAGYYGDVKIMLPMITTLSEIKKARDLIEIAKDDLKKRKILFDDNVKIGIMIEVPAAAVLSSRLAEFVDFLSIGTNDLVQYTLAIDRVDDEVNYLYDPFNSAVLMLIKNVIDSGERHGIDVSLCGEMAGDKQFTRLLLGMGLRSFSMHPSAIPEVKKVIVESNIGKLNKLASKIIKCVDSVDKQNLIEKINNDSTNH